MIIYASKKFWFWENGPYGVRLYIRPPLHVSGCEMAHCNTFCVKLAWFWTSMLWLIDSCQKRVSADQHHMTASRAQVYNSWKWRNYLLTSCSFLIDCRHRSIILEVEFSLLSAYGQSIINWELRKNFLKHLSRALLLALAKSICYSTATGDRNHSRHYI